jgi:hypothetical protein
VPPFVLLVKCGIQVILDFLVNVVLEVRVLEGDTPTVGPETIAKGGRPACALADQAANERDWANFSASAPLRPNRDRKWLRKAEAGRINLPHRSDAGRVAREPVILHPLHRIEPIRGTSDVENCMADKRDPPARCFGITSLARTLVGIIRQKDVGCLTLVLEDDYQVTNAAELPSEEVAPYRSGRLGHYSLAATSREAFCSGNKAREFQFRSSKASWHSGRRAGLQNRSQLSSLSLPEAGGMAPRATKTSGKATNEVLDPTRLS